MTLHTFKVVGAGQGSWGGVWGRDFSHWTSSMTLSHLGLLGPDRGHGERFRVGTSRTGLLL